MDSPTTVEPSSNTGLESLISRIQSELTPEQAAALHWLRESNSGTLKEWQSSTGDAVALTKGFLSDCQTFSSSFEQANATFSERLQHFSNQLKSQMQHYIDAGELRIRFQLENDRLNSKYESALKDRSAAVARAEQLDKQMNEMMETMRQQKDHMANLQRDMDIVNRKHEQASQLQSKLENLKWQAETKMLDEKKRADDAFVQLEAANLRNSQQAEEAKRREAELKGHHDDDVRALNRIIDQLKSSSEQHGQSESTLRQQLEAKNAELTKAHAHVEQLQLQIHHNETAHAGRVDELMATIRARESRISDFEREVVRLRDNIRYLESNVEGEEANKKLKDVELNTTQQKIEALKAELQAAKEESASKDSRVSALHTRTSMLEGACTGYKEEIDKLNTKISGLEGRISELNKTLATERATIDTQKHELSARDDQIALLKTAIGNLKQKVHEGDMVGQHLRSEVDRLNVEINERKGEIAVLTEEINTLTLLKAKEIQMRDDMSQMYTSSQATVEQLKQEIADLKSTHTRSLELAEQEYTRKLQAVVDGQLALVGNTKESLNAQILQRDAQITSLTEQNQELAQQLDELNMEQQSMESLLEEKENEIAQYKETAATVEAMQLDHETEIAKHVAEIDRMREVLAAAETEKDRLSTELETARQQHQELSEEIESYESVQIKLEAERDALQSEVDSLRVQLVEAEKKAEETATRLSAEHAQLSSQLTEEKENYLNARTQLARAEISLEQTQQEKQDAESMLSITMTENSELRKMYDDEKARLLQLQEESDALKDRVNIVENEKQKIEDELNQVNARVRQLESQLVESQNRAGLLHASLELVQGNASMQHNALEENLRLREQVNSLATQLNSTARLPPIVEMPDSPPAERHELISGPLSPVVPTHTELVQTPAKRMRGRPRKSTSADSVSTPTTSSQSDEVLAGSNALLSTPTTRSSRKRQAEDPAV